MSWERRRIARHYVARVNNSLHVFPVWRGVDYWDDLRGFIGRMCDTYENERQGYPVVAIVIEIGKKVGL